MSTLLATVIGAWKYYRGMSNVFANCRFIALDMPDILHGFWKKTFHDTPVRNIVLWQGALQHAASWSGSFNLPWHTWQPCQMDWPTYGQHTTPPRQIITRSIITRYFIQYSNEAEISSFWGNCSHWLCSKLSMATSGATADGNSVKMASFQFQWIEEWR